MLRVRSRQTYLIGLFLSISGVSLWGQAPGLEPNVGQLPKTAKFGTRAAGYELLLTDSGAVFRLESGGEVRFQISGGNGDARAVAGERLPGVLNFYPDRD